ncbi:MAG: hypothetical protein ACOYOL_00650 [Chthoniobacterales bacterium]|jgi:Zn-dependent alcohol dehydrogenase
MPHDQHVSIHSLPLHFGQTINASQVNAAEHVRQVLGGRCGLFRVMPSDQRVSIHTLPLHFGRILTSQSHRDMPRILDALASYQTDLSGFISHRGSLSEFNDIMARMRAGQVIHAVLQP